MPKSSLYSSTFALLLAGSSLQAATQIQPAPVAENVTRMEETTTTTSDSALAENTPVGVTGRPEWTGARRFPDTRVYIQQEPWEVGVEAWWRMKSHRDGTASDRLLQEVEIGLPYRMQLDLYNDIEGDSRGHFHNQSVNVELRYAFADWGKIWGNPTLYAEYKFADHHWGPDVYELKVLLGDDIGKRWHWGFNVIWEAEEGGDREQEFQIAGGISYAVIDQKLGIGLEFLYDHDTLKNSRADVAQQFNFGPSIQYRITPNLHVDLDCMFGMTRDSDREIAFLIIGYDFGKSSHAERQYTPAAGRQE